MVVEMFNLKNIMSLSLALSVLLSASQAEAKKRKWDEMEFEATSNSAREPQFFDPNEQGNEDFEYLEEVQSNAPQGTISRFSMPGFSEWLNSEDYERHLFDLEIQSAMTSSKTFWIKPDSKEKSYNATQTQVLLQTPQTDFFDDRNPIDILVEQYLANEWNPNPRPSFWPIMDPAEISEDREEVDDSTLAFPKTEPDINPGDSTEPSSSRSPSIDFTETKKDGDETDSDKENHTLPQPKNGRRFLPSMLEISTQFVATYKRFSETLTGGALNKAIMTALNLNRSAFTMLLDKARYDHPEIAKSAKRIKR